MLPTTGVCCWVFSLRRLLVSGCCVGSEEKVYQSQLYEREMMLQPSLSFFPSFFFPFSSRKVGSKISSECTIMYVWVIG